ncbi:MAG: hypothetical protein M0Z95_00345 [Actinomycetota bacterium]|nr:hypothetical protein [Actinomycetota bacterium]
MTTPAAQHVVGSTQSISPRPRLWLRVGVRTGLAAQGAATAAGAALLATAGGWLQLGAGLRETALVLGLLIVYLDTHAACHYLVGRPLGIGFRGFGLRGTDHPELYPPGLRQVMSVLPMWVALTEPTSRRAASRFALAAMYAAGETATTVCTVGAAGAAAAAHAPWGLGALWVVAVFSAASSVVVAVIPKGDYAKARHALRG